MLLDPTRARLRLARLIVDERWPVAQAARRYEVSWRTAKRWADRYLQLGADGTQLGRCTGRTAGETRGIVGHPVFGKTGTTDDDKTASLIVGTTSMVVAGYLVNPDYQNHPYRMDHGVVDPAVQHTLRDIMKGKPKVSFQRPGNSRIALGEQRSIPDVSCLSVAEATSRLQGAGFTASVGTGTGSDCPEGTAAGTVPSGRTVKGGSVSIRVSDGNPAGPPGSPPD